MEREVPTLCAKGSQPISFKTKQSMRPVGSLHHASPLTSLLSRLNGVSVGLRVSRKRSCVPGVVVMKKEKKEAEKVGEMLCESEKGVLAVPVRKQVVEKEEKEEEKEVEVVKEKKEVTKEEEKEEKKEEKKTGLVCPVLQPPRLNAVSIKIPSTRLVIESPEEPLVIKTTTLWEKKVARGEKIVKAAKREARRKCLLRLSADFEKEEKEMMEKKPAVSAAGFGAKEGGKKEEKPAPAFAFAAAKKEEKEKPATSGFSFGAAKEEEKRDKPAPAFAFGAQKEKKEKPAFSFGGKKEKEGKPATPAFAFGEKEEKPAYSYGGKKEKKENTTATA